jgi:hypothetical protein
MDLSLEVHRAAVPGQNRQSRQTGFGIRQPIDECVPRAEHHRSKGDNRRKDSRQGYGINKNKVMHGFR